MPRQGRADEIVRSPSPGAELPHPFTEIDRLGGAVHLGGGDVPRKLCHSCSRRAATGVGITRSSMPSAIELVGDSSVAGIANSRTSAAAAAAP